ncbi:MAG: hypothetical protein ACLVBW_12375 [Lachnospiraceae bacterium]
MRKFKQIFASFLAMNLTISTVATGMMNVSAAEEYSSEAAVETYAEESAQTYAEDTVAPEQVISETDAAYYSSDIGSEVTDTAVVSAETDTTASTVSADIETTAVPVPGGENQTEMPTEAPTDTPTETSTEIPAISSTEIETTAETTDSTPSIEESSQIADVENTTEVNETETEEVSTEEETSEEESEEESTEEETTEESYELAVLSAEDYLDINWFRNYKSDTKTVEINGNGNEVAQQLILLSNCKPEQIQGINIYINIAGDIDITEKNKIPQGTDLTTILKNVSNASVVASDESVAEEDAESKETTSVTAPREYTFRGFGTKEIPFQGRITGIRPSALYVDHTFFCGLSSKATAILGESPLQITWQGKGDIPMIADFYQFDDEKTDGHELPITVKGDSNGTMGSLIGTVKSADTITAPQKLSIKNNIVDYNNASAVAVATSEGNAGLICNTLESGSICLDGYQFPTGAYTIESSASYDIKNTSAAGNAGGVIGVMKIGTALEIKSGVNLTGVTVTSSNGNAGGLVGLIEKGAKITTSNDAAMTLSNPNITGTVSAGGVVGTAEDVVFADGDMQSAITVSSPTVTSNTTAGGFIGKYTLNAASFATEGAEPSLLLPNKVEIETPTLTVSNNGVAGGYFGYLNLNGKLTYTICNSDATAKRSIAPTYENCSAEAIGAIAGKVTSDTIASTLLIQNVSVNATNSSGTGIQYHGGLIGEIGQTGENTTNNLPVYLRVDSVDISVINPKAKDEEKKGFGGITGLLAQGSIVQTNNITVTTSDTTINRGGGLVGYAEKSVINVSGTTNLSGVIYDKDSGKNAKTGWLVGWQESALIYANGDGNGNGWTYIRGKENTTGKQAMNDIGNYGQIIRLHSADTSSAEKSKLSSDLITIDATNHTVSYGDNTAPTVSENTITLNSTDAFARLSICWNTRGYFGGIETISQNTTPSSKSITLNSDIDLTGSGITGLSRDSYSIDDTYAGTFNGGGYTITLASGETFGFKQDNTGILALSGDDCYGEVISAGASYHGRQGLFALVGNNANIQNLIIAGNIWISNAGQDILAGGIAGEAVKDSTVNIKGVKVAENIKADCEVNQTLVAGGFFGGCYNGNVNLNFEKYGEKKILNETATKIEIQSSNTTDDTKIFVGGIIGEFSGKNFKVSGLRVTGSIKTDQKKKAYVGGFAGVMKDTQLKKIEIDNVIFDGFEIEAQNVTDICGGLISSICNNAELYFKDANDTGNASLYVKDATINAENTKSLGGLAYRIGGMCEIKSNGVNLEKLIIKAKTDVGLLVCRGEKGKEKIAGKDDWELGALYLYTTNWDNSYRIGNEVNITVTNPGVFDEFVAYTTPKAPEIVDSGKNGVISIATEDITADGVTSRVGVDPANECTTYRNRTTYGQNQKTNAYSRYYYDLDQCLTDVGNSSANSKIDTPQELLLYSVYKYACSNIKNYFVSNKNTDTKLDAGSWVNIIQNVESLDMSKYSYYPIKIIEVIPVKVSNIKLKFNNENIETQEKYNKSTQGTDEEHTQHYAMHCGLFLYFQGSQLIVNNVEFSGSIGQVYESNAGRDSSNKQYAVKGSGVLVSSFASGNASIDGTKSRYLNIRITNITLNGLKVTDCKESYAPLLINNIGSRYSTNYIYGYTKLTVDTVTVSRYSTETSTAVASSLIGNVGDSKAKSITMTFTHIVLPDKKADGTDNGGIFSHATLLERFAYASDDNTSGATYNFLSSEDWTGNEHKHNVTYGYEITKTTEFEGLQNWYYDESTYKLPEGLVYDNVNNKKNFDSSDYLRYVSTPYDASACMHEIKVNQRVVDITNGCGTYGHPYRITKESEMNILSDYMATGNPSKDWRVTITKNQTEVHTGAEKDYTSDQDITYQYDGSTYWEQVEKTGTGVNEKWQVISGGVKLNKDFMRYYLLNAYYDIRGTVVQGNTVTDTNEATQVADGEDNSASNPELILNNFKGFGTRDNPFRGVITSTNNTTLVLKGAETGNGLIPYSYGSVVKNLTILYRGSERKTLTYTDQDTVAYVPSAYFGGAIGCVLGGDNIIDNVTVGVADDWKITLDGNKSHLIQIGGYVGSIAGGGVIFRDMMDGTGLTADWIESVSDISSYTNLYVNPYVGRVLDGYAFYEKKSAEKNVVDSLNNTNKNYTINTLKEEACVSATDNSITVNNAQGLLVLSAIVNSGAASGGSSRAYSKTGDSDGKAITAGTKNYAFGGKYGKVRNVLYSAIGNVDNDAITSITEDRNVPGADNLPYLIKAYCGESTSIFSSLTADNLEIVLSNKADTFDMTSYQNGYQGIGARYVSNAVRGTNGSNNPEGVIPEVKSFNGNNKNVTVDMQVSEYADDDYPAASVGGIFNVVRVSDNETLSNVIIQQSTNSISTQEDADTSEETKTIAGISLTYYNSDGEKGDTSCNNKKEVGLGGFAGSLVGYTAKNASRDITVSGIRVSNLTIDSPASVGGIFGNVGKPAERKNSNIAILLQPQDSQMTYGVAFNNCSYQNLNVTGKYAAGGFAGYIGGCDTKSNGNLSVNPATTVSGQTNNQISGQNSTISATYNASIAGGLFGYVKTRLFINMTENGETDNSKKTILENVGVSAKSIVGGCVGQIAERTYSINNVIVKITLTDSSKQIMLNEKTIGTFYAGGIIGYAKGSKQWWGNWKYVGWISNSSIENATINDIDKAANHNYEGSSIIQTNYIAGGIIGQTAGGQTRIESCTVTASDIYGSVASGITGQTDSQMEFINCEVNGTSEDSKTNIKGFSTAGGILGFWQGRQTVTIQGCKIQYLEVEGKDWGSGAIIGDAQSNGAGVLYLFDTSVQDSTVTAVGNKGDAGGRWPTVGGITGNLRNKIVASNLLFSNVTLNGTKGSISKKVPMGLLFGNVTSDSIAINIAGISIQNIPDNNKKFGLSGSGSVSSDNDYIAFADYSGTALSSTTTDNQATDTQGDAKTSLVGNSNDLLGSAYKPADTIKTDVASPYVVTSPKSTLALYDNATSSSKYLYGDGVSWTTSSSDSSDSSTTEGGDNSDSSATGSTSSVTTSFTVKAQEIWNERNGDSSIHYTYKKIASTSFDFNSMISTYNTNQTNKAESDFPVVQISSGNTDKVSDYLDILTNGGFSAANKVNSAKDIHVTATAVVYQYKGGKFVKALNEDNTPVTPAFKVNTDASGKITFSTTTDYDNERDRFTLLTVTFTEEGHHYNVFVPVLVRRMLEMDFMATLTYGTDFNASDYNGLITHVLESFGSPITGYLTYRYNSDMGKYTEYGWQSYINVGGNVMDMKKSIKFAIDKENLPAGTQLTLVDAKDKRAYYYTATGKEASNGNVLIALSSFADSQGNPYQEPSISELIQAKASDQGGNKLFIKVDENGKPENAKDEDGRKYPEPTVRIKNETTGKYEYYRLAVSGETATHSITVNEAGLKGTGGVSDITENYYLVINVPKNAANDILNGSIQTVVESVVPHRVHHLERGTSKEDLHSNTQSTYVLSSGYQQSLTESTTISELHKEISAADSSLLVDVVDKITFPNGQAYNDSDELYLRIVGSLQKTLNGTTSGEQFPSGTTGTAEFYVYNEGQTTYYQYTNGSWSPSSEKSVAVQYTWTSDGGNMELPLGEQTENGVEPISLQAVRTAIKGIQNTNQSTFYVEVRMTVNIPASGLDVIPESKFTEGSGPMDYVKLAYSSQLSTVSRSLAYSNNRASCSNTKTEYYRIEPTGAKLTYEADTIDQLGINLLDPQYLDVSKEHALIDTTAVYSLASMKNLDDALKNSTGIRFTLTLAPKNTASGSTMEDYADALTNANDYLAIELKSKDSGEVTYDNGKGTWSWTVPQSTYWSNGNIKTDSVFDGSVLTQAIQLKVNAANVELNNHYYSNYKVVLTAEIVKDENAIDGTHQVDNIIYTLARINMEFVDGPAK